ncbi:MAG: right-handed parallel beta-helix repeat-containing protein, partial [Pirellulaceae bacterium]|nr:right-handed parallel beta-helix repeat-containing protein [Pirellulaceae bacterium]
ITTTELTQSLAEVLRVSVDGAAQVAFEFGGRIGADGPGITSSIEAHWSLLNPTVITFGTNGSTNPLDAFTAPKYYLGEFIERMIGPVFAKIQQYNPIPKDVTDFLNSNLPILNITPWQLLTAGVNLPEGADLVFRIATAINNLPTNSDRINLQRFLPNEPAGGGDGNQQGNANSTLLNYLTSLETDYGLSLPFLRAPKKNIVKLLVGQRVDFINWRPTKPLSLSKEITGTPIFLGQYGPITVILNYGGRFGLNANLGFGLDSTGLQSSSRNLLDGFYFSDRDKTNREVNEVEVTGGVFVRADASLVGLAGLSIEGGISGTIGADLTDLRPGATAGSPERLARFCDSGSDGAVHLTELARIANDYGIQNVVNVNGNISIDVKIDVFVLFWSATIISEKFPIVRFGRGCSGSPSSLLRDFTTLGRVDNGEFVRDTLTVFANNAFPSSNFSADDDLGTELEINLRRDTNNVPTGIELVRIRESERQFMRYSLAELAQLRHLKIVGSSGPDSIVIDPDLSSILNIQTIEVDANAGDDYVDLFQRTSVTVGNLTLSSNLQNTTIYGRSGRDQLRGTFAADTILGGEQDDMIDGRDGNNTLYGDNQTETGQFIITSGNDTIKGGQDRDTIYGGFGNDVINAGDGENIVYGGWGFDLITTGNGSDILHGGNPSNAPSPNIGVDLGDDVILSTGGNDTVFGGGGNDTIDVVHGTLDGGDGHDFLRVLSGQNDIYGGAGNDHIIGGSGTDTIYGDDVGATFTGHDLIEDTGGDNTIYAGKGNDIVRTGAGADTIYGNDGIDQIDAGDGTNRLFGGEHDDVLTGGAGIDYIFGDGGHDTLLGGEGNNFLFGGDGNDSLTAGHGNNQMFGRLDGPTILPADDIDRDQFIVGDGINLLVGNGGKDTFGSLTNRSNGQNTVWGDDRFVPSAFDDDDVIYLGNGTNNIHGGLGSDDIIFGSGNNLVWGDHETPTFANGALIDGNDTIINAVVGLSNTLWIDGGGGVDIITTRAANVTVIGGAARDVITVHSPLPGSIVYADNQPSLGNTFPDESILDGNDDVTLSYIQGDRFVSTGITVYGTGGIDTVVSTGIGNVTIFGGSGGDPITVNGSLSATVFGDRLLEAPTDGSDTINVTSDNARVFAGGHDDNISVSAPASYEVRGGSGIDRIHVTGSLLSQDSGTIYGDQSTTVNASDGTDYISVFGPTKIWATGGNDEVTVNNSLGGDTEIYGDTGNDTITMIGGGLNRIFAGSGHDSVVSTYGSEIVWGGDGDDEISTGGNVDEVHGESGNDKIYGGAGFDALYGDAGDDWLVGNDGEDRLDGGDGQDILVGDNAIISPSPLLAGFYEVSVLSGGSTDVLLGGLGNDRLFGGGGSDRMFGHEGIDRIEGNEGDDLIEGGDGNDFLSGAAGEDEIYGQAGDDTINGGDDADLILGDIGNDIINAGAGDDRVYGHDGNDTIEGGSGNDRIYGSTGNDTITAGAGIDLVYGDAGDDNVDGGDDADELYGGTGVDRISGGRGIDHIYGHDGDDVLAGYQLATSVGDDGTSDYLIGGLGNDTLTGGGGDDYLEGNEDRDTIRGEAGNDLIFAGTGLGDHLDGGDGDDTIHGSDESLAPGPNILYSGDTILGGPGSDRILGLGGYDWIDAGAGDDWVDGGTDSDTIRGGDGNDFLYAGLGFSDTLYGDGGHDTIYGSDAGDDTIFGGSGDDRIEGQAGNDVLEGGDGDDIIDGGTGTDIILGNSGDDELIGGGGVGDLLYGGQDHDVLRGSDDGADILLGGIGNDRLFGNGGNDLLSGGDRDDILDGDELPDGDDVLDGGAGDDILEGNAGADLLIGGLDHDKLYGHTLLGTDDDLAADRLYGDLGTDGNEPGSGSDHLRGQGGNDFLFGEGGDDRLDDIQGENQLFFGAGDGPVPNDFVTPPITTAPALTSRTAFRVDGAQLPTGPEPRGWYSPLADSTSGDGVSQVASGAKQSAVAVDASGITYTAWVDVRSGNEEIYVARYVPGELATASLSAGWSELAGSASAGGISRTVGSSREPSIAIDHDNLPMVVWTESRRSGAIITSDIRAVKWNPSGNAGLGLWESIGSSQSTGGISATGNASQPKVVRTTSGPVVAWLDATSGGQQVYVTGFRNGAWSGLGGQATSSGQGLSASPGTVTSMDLSSQNDFVVVAWTDRSALGAQVFASQFNGTVWQSLGATSSAGSPINDTVAAAQVTTTYFQNQPFVAWQDSTNEVSSIRVQRRTAIAWTSAGEGSNTDLGVSSPDNQAYWPVLSSGGNALYLNWIDRPSPVGSTLVGGGWNLRSWNGTSFAQQPNLARLPNGRWLGNDIQTLDMSVDALGRTVISWNALNESRNARQSYVVRGNNLPSKQIHVTSASQTIASILASGQRGTNDVILVSDVQGGFTLTPDDAGVSIIGLTGSSINGPVSINAHGVTLDNLNLASLLLQNANDFSMQQSTANSVVIDGGNSAWLVDNAINSVTITGGATASQLHRNTLGTLLLSGAGASQISVTDNLINGLQAVTVQASSSGRMTGNRLHASSPGSKLGTGLLINQVFSGIIAHNEIQGFSVGVQYNAAASLSHNRIFDNQTGVVANPVGANGLGFTPNSTANVIEDNQVGVLLNGDMQLQIIRSNVTGVRGSGSLVASSLEHANWIEANTVGVDLSGRIAFNRIGLNATGILARSGQTIDHNILVDNTEYGIRSIGKSDLKIINNTLVAFSRWSSENPIANTSPADLIRIEQSSSHIEILNNLLSSGSGYAIYVAVDSMLGYFSDYNLLHSSEPGKLIHWAGEYNDILDWQENVHQFDLHSRGRTEIDPQWSRPKFINPRLGDYRLFDLVAGQRATNPSIDLGMPWIDFPQPTFMNQNLLVNPGFESGLNGWTVTPSGIIASSNPAPSSGTNYFASGNTAVTTLTQVIDLQALAIDMSDKSIVFGGRVRNKAESPADQPEITLEFLNAIGQVVGSISQQPTGTADRWELIGGRATVPETTTRLRFTFTGTRRTTNANDTFLDGAFLYAVSNRMAPDVGAYGAASDELAASSAPRIVLRAPDLYRDWQKHQQLPILWETYGNATSSPVRIDLYQDAASGAQYLLTIAASAPDTGRFDWTPALNNIDFGTKGLRLQIQLTNAQIAFDRSTESFSVPENSPDYYVNDASRTGDLLTTAIGNNRHTGKVPSSPKPLPTNVLRIYTVGAGQTINIDSGTDLVPTPLVIGNVADVSDDEGFTLAGAISASPTPQNISVTLVHNDPVSNGANIELSDADLTTLRNIRVVGGQNAILVRNQSNQVLLDNIESHSATQAGIRVEAGSSISVNRLRTLSNGGQGFFSEGTVSSITSSQAIGNGAAGFLLRSPGPVRIESSLASGNFGNGIEVTNVGLAMATVGSSDLTLGKGNQVFSNLGNGLWAAGNVNVEGNTIYGQNTVGTVGIRLELGASARANVVFNNQRGIQATGGGNVDRNRVYNHASYGISADITGSLSGNVVYSNSVGISLGSSQQGVVENNLVYANTDVAVQSLSTTTTPGLIKNNTIYQPSGDGIRLTNADHVQLRNNIIWVGAGYGIRLLPLNVTGFVSDYNLIYTTGNGAVGRRANNDWKTLSEWSTAMSSDANSLAVDPLFVDLDGADNRLGYFSPTANGSDDDFHLLSQQGSPHGGALAPSVSPSGSGFTLPSQAASPIVIDAVTSLAIDAGQPNDLFSGEPSPNGNAIDLGAYGNTSHASLSPAQFVTLQRPTAAQVVPANQPLAIRWRSHDSLGTVRLELIRVADGNVLTIGSGVANSGNFNWLVPTGTTPGQYHIRITREDAAIAGITQASFTIVAPVTVYYVNDGTVAAGDWTTAVGIDGNDGLSPSRPKASVQSVLDSYTLGPGSVIRVDAGIYNLNASLTISSADAGVTIEGFYDSTTSDPSKRALINRGLSTAGNHTIVLQNADNVTLSRLHITGGNIGVFAGTTSDSDNVTIRDSRIYNNAISGVSIDTGNDGLQLVNNQFSGIGAAGSATIQSTHAVIAGANALVADNLIVDGSNYGLRVSGGGTRVTRNQVFNNTTGIIVASADGTQPTIRVTENMVSGNYDYGMDVSGANVIVENNQITNNVSGYTTFTPRKATGIRLTSSAIVRDNLIADNIVGIESVVGAGIGFVLKNRIYGNSTGIIAAGGSLIDNEIHSNAIGV